WIEVICNQCHQVQRAYIKPGEPAQAEFKTCSDDVIAREYCNLHGLWQSKK
ncbi:MAG: desulfoferrodoxin, partial [Elusimicrobiaceae bacterium]|nr:desulfoferrodoxin [Elusimicrobiaceae bacterium]